METLQSTIFIEFDVNTKKITFLRKDNIIDYDSDATSVYVRVKYKNLSNNTIYLAFVIQTGSDATNAEVSRFCVPGSTGSINSKAVRAIKITNPKNASELMHVTEGKIIDYSQIASNKKFNQYGEFKELFDSSNLHPNIDSTDGMT